MKKIQYIVSTTIVAIPFIAFAATDKKLSDLIATIAGYFNSILALMMGFAVVMFVWYVIKYFIQPNDKRTEAGQYIMWSLIGFFVIFSMWGLVNILISTFDLGTGSPSTWTDFSSLFPK